MGQDQGNGVPSTGTCSESTETIESPQTTRQGDVYWRMPLSFGPYPGPRQDCHGLIQNTQHSTFATTSVKFKTSRTLLQNLLPSASYQFASSSTFAFASYSQTTLDKMDWLGGKGYNYLGLYLHGVQYTKKDGSILNGDYLVVMWEDLTDPILSGREELGFPKLYSEIDVEETAQTWSMKATWRDTTWIRLELKELQVGNNPASTAPADNLFVYKYVPATGKRGIADVEYPVCLPTPRGAQVSQSQYTSTGSITVDPHTLKALPTMHHIATRLAELPVHEIVGGTVTRGTGVSDFSSAYRIE